MVKIGNQRNMSGSGGFDAHEKNRTPFLLKKEDYSIPSEMLLKMAELTAFPS
jgi:hypothetical protein